MKIRNGFVSNSSSSSFLIGLAIVKPEYVAQVRDLVDEHNTSWSNNLKCKRAKFFSNGEYRKEKVETTNGLKIVNEASVNSGTSIDISCNPDDYILYVNIGNDEGDEKFWDDTLGVLDYDKVTLDYFDKNVVDLIKNQDYYQQTALHYGADRNG